MALQTFPKLQHLVINVSSICGILKMVGPKKQDFWPKINKLEGNHCILRLLGAPVRQKLGMILKNKWFKN